MDSHRSVLHDLYNGQSPPSYEEATGARPQGQRSTPPLTPQPKPDRALSLQSGSPVLSEPPVPHDPALRTGEPALPRPPISRTPTTLRAGVLVQPGPPPALPPRPGVLVQSGHPPALPPRPGVLVQSGPPPALPPRPPEHPMPRAPVSPQWLSEQVYLDFLCLLLLPYHRGLVAYKHPATVTPGQLAGPTSCEARPQCPQAASNSGDIRRTGTSFSAPST